MNRGSKMSNVSFGFHSNNGMSRPHLHTRIVERLFGPFDVGPGLVDLVDGHDHADPRVLDGADGLQGLLQRPFNGVDDLS